MLPGVVDGRPVRTESAPFLLNAEPGGGMGHYRRRDVYDDDGLSDSMRRGKHILEDAK